MIQSFKDADSKELFEMRSNRRWRAVEAVALRKLDQIEASVNVADLRVPPGNRLQALKGDRAGRHSIRSNNQSFICFLWNKEGAHEVEITDDHEERVFHLRRQETVTNDNASTSIRMGI